MITEDLIPGRKTSWFDVEKPDSQDFEILSEKFNLPYLLVQDTLRPEHLPKYEFTEEGHFFMLRAYDQESTDASISVQELTRKIAIFISDHRLVTIHRIHFECVDKISNKIKKNHFPWSIQKIVHEIILEVVRSYEKRVTSLQDIYDDFEKDILSKKNKPLDFTRIYRFRRQIFVIKRILKQTEEALYRSKDFWKGHQSMFQDVKENIDQIYYELDEISDNFEHLFQLHISLNDQRANEVMKVLTVFSSIILPINFIASFYGMNFKFIPGLESPSAILWVLASMTFIGVGLMWFFKRKGWFFGGD
jgi:magnesium transporter